MARPKKFAQRVLVRLTEAQLSDIQIHLGEHEDRSEFLRQATDLEIAIRKLDVYRQLTGYLTANETMADFCAKAVRRAALARIAMLADADEKPALSNERPASST